MTEHRIQIPPEWGQADTAAAAPAPEKGINRFVRILAVIERLGNALGTLAFTWATVVLLGGYPTVLGSNNDFWFATAIVFLEALRMFSSRNNRSDYQLFFRTRGAFRSLGGNGLIMIVYFWGATSTLSLIVLEHLRHLAARILLVIMVTLLPVVGLFLCRRTGSRRRRRNCNWVCRAISLWSPVVATLLLASSILRYYNQQMHKTIFRHSLALWIPYVLLSVVVLLVTISRLRFPIIINLVHGALGSKHVFWRQFILNSCMFAAIVMLVVMVDPEDRIGMIFGDICAVAILSFGNLQVPAALVRVVLPLLRLGPHDYFADVDMTNLGSSLNIFYGMVLGQGILYIVAGMLEIFSFIPRKSLIRHGGFTGQWGLESVNLYYAYAFNKYMEGGVFAPNRISLSNFAMDSLNSDFSKNQFYGIRMMHSFLQREPTKTQLLEKLTTSMQTMARLISMLDWTGRNHHTAIRLYAAKVTTELAKSLQLRVVTVPGTMKFVSTLLDTDRSLKRGHPLLNADDDQDPFVDTAERQEKIQDAAGDQGQRQELLADTDNLLETPTRSTHINGQRCIIRSWRRKISEYWSVPKEQSLTDDDLLPDPKNHRIHELRKCNGEFRSTAKCACKVITEGVAEVDKH